MKARPKANLCLLPHLSMASSKGLVKCGEMEEMMVSVCYGRVCRDFRCSHCWPVWLEAANKRLELCFI